MVFSPHDITASRQSGPKARACLAALALLAVWATPAGASSPGSPSLFRPASPATSGNWAGYVATGARYSEVSGSFVVPNLSYYMAGSTASEWVGVDGWSNSTLVQAGVNEIPLGTGITLFEPWWEIVPGPQQLATGMMVGAGQRIRVQLRQGPAHRWSISLLDTTNKDSFSTTQPYAGPASSAEWVVEADSTTNGSTTVLAPLGGPVSFTNMGLEVASSGAGTGLEAALQQSQPLMPADGGDPAALTKVVMVQDGCALATPSPLAQGAFSVAYAGKPTSAAQPLAPCATRSPA